MQVTLDIPDALASDRALLKVTRTASASPATGIAKAHDLEEKTLIDLALGHGA